MSRRAHPCALSQVVIRPHAERVSTVHRRLDSSERALAVGNHRKALLVYPAPSQPSWAPPALPPPIPGQAFGMESPAARRRLIPLVRGPLGLSSRRRRAARAAVPTAAIATPANHDL